MKIGQHIWVVLDTRRGQRNEIFESDVGLPCIFDNEDDALDIADRLSWLVVAEARIQSLSVY